MSDHMLLHCGNPILRSCPLKFQPWRRKLSKIEIPNMSDKLLWSVVLEGSNQTLLPNIAKTAEAAFIDLGADTPQQNRKKHAAFCVPCPL